MCLGIENKLLNVVVKGNYIPAQRIVLTSSRLAFHIGGSDRLKDRRNLMQVKNKLLFGANGRHSLGWQNEEFIIQARP